MWVKLSSITGKGWPGRRRGNLGKGPVASRKDGRRFAEAWPIAGFQGLHGPF
jgi:hypothetical protein